MAKYVIAGKSDCPFYAKAELLADELQSRLKDFKVHKIVIQPDEWQGWVSQTCKEKNWTYSGKSPMIWKELLDRGGKGLLLGSCSDFLEMANGYYGITSEKLTEELKNIAKENNMFHFYHLFTAYVVPASTDSSIFKLLHIVWNQKISIS